METQKTIYVDNAATTCLSSEVLQSMLPFLKENYGNPSTFYSIGRKAKEAVETAREAVAVCLGAVPQEVFFTSGGTESDNWAIKGAAFVSLKKGKNHIITSNIEHHAVLHTVEFLSKNGFDVTYIKVDEKGLINPKDIESAITEKTALVSIMYANNEIGTVQPIKEIGQICRKRGVLFHTDAVQAIGHISMDVVQDNVDLLSISAHKFHGPKGVGALYIKKGIKIQNLIEGGAQERGMRAGTENVAGIVGMEKAMEIACEDIEEKNSRLIKLRDKIIRELLKIEHSRLNGDALKRLPNNVNISFEGIEGESILLMLDAQGICASSGSACTSGSLDPSHVLLAIGLPHETAHGSLRITLSADNTNEEADFIIEQVKKVVCKLRKLSPVWEKIVENKG